LAILFVTNTFLLPDFVIRADNKENLSKRKLDVRSNNNSTSCMFNGSDTEFVPI